MPNIREEFQELEGVLRTIYDLDMQKKPDYIPQYFNEDSSKKAEENHFGVGSIGLMKKWAGTVNYDTLSKRWKTVYHHEKYSNGLQLERELMDDEEYTEIKRRTRLLSSSVYLTRQTHGASVFNNAFDTNFIGADGKPLCAKTGAGHPYSPEDDEDTQYNADTLDLTPSNIEVVRNRMIDFRDDRGNVLGVMPDTLIVGNSYWKKAKEILGTDKEPYSAENTINVWNKEFKLRYNPWIVGKKWFLADSEKEQLFLNWYNRRIPKIEYIDDFDTEVGKYKVVGRWSYGWDEWCFLYGNIVG